MARAWIGGKEATLEHAVAEAAGLLAASRCPLIAGLGADIAGARAAIGLAERIGAVIDHMNSEVLLRELAVARKSGMMMATPSEARLRADKLLLVGSGLEGAWQGLREWRGQSVWLCPGHAATVSPTEKVRIAGRDPDQLPIVLAALRARIAGRPAGNGGLPAKTNEAVAQFLRSARFGVAVWSASSLDPLAVEMLSGLVDDLNAETRFTGFSLVPRDNAVGVLQACGWMTGFPMRTGFGRGYPEHDPWRFAAGRMVASGEADCVLWISAYRAAAPPWDEGPPLIALVTGEAELGGRPAVQIEVGRPGVDHDSIEHHPVLGALVSMSAAQPTETIPVVDAIGRIVAALPGAAPGVGR